MKWEDLRASVESLKAQGDWPAIADLARELSLSDAPVAADFALMYELFGVGLMRAPSGDGDLRAAKAWLLKAAACPVPDEQLCRISVSLAAVNRMMGDERGVMNALAGWTHRNAGQFAWHVTQHRGVWCLRTGRFRKAARILSLALKLAKDKPILSQYTFVTLQEALIECGEVETAVRNLLNQPLIPSLEGSRLALLCMASARLGKLDDAIVYGVKALHTLRKGASGDATQSNLYMPMVYATLIKTYEAQGKSDLVAYCKQSLLKEVVISNAVKDALLNMTTLAETEVVTCGS